MVPNCKVSRRIAQHLLIVGALSVGLGCAKPVDDSDAVASKAITATTRIVDTGSAATSAAKKLEMGVFREISKPPFPTRFSLDLQVGEAVALQVEQLDFDLRVEVFDPAGRPLLAFDGPYGTSAPERICFWAQDTGAYSVEIAAYGRRGGEFQIELRHRRPATVSDRACERAAKIFMASERSRFAGSLSDALVKDYHRAHALWAEAEEPFLAAVALRQAGIVLRQMGRGQEMEKPFREALFWARRSASVYLEASLLIDLGQAAMDRGGWDEAFRLFRGALSRAEASGLTRVESNALGHLAWVAEKRGETHLAIEHLQDALQLRSHLEEDQETAQLKINLANLYILLDRYREALVLMEGALSSIRTAGDVRREASALISLGWLLHLMEDDSAGIAQLRRALRLYEQIGDLPGQLSAYDRLGTVLLSDGRMNDALVAYQRALGLGRQSGNEWTVTGTKINLGCLYHRMGRSEQAVRYLAAARRRLETVEDPKALARLELCMAKIEWDAGRVDRALHHIEEARTVVKALQRLARGRGARYGPVWLWQDFAELHAELLIAKARSSGDEKLEKDAFELIDLARSETLYEIILEGRSEFPPLADEHLSARKRELQRDLNAKAEERQALLVTRIPKERRDEVEAAIDGLLAELERLQADLRAAEPRIGRWLEPREVDVTQLQESLGPHTSLLRYVLAEDKGFLFVVGRHHWQVWPLAGRRQLDAQVKTFYRGLLRSQDEPRQSLLAASYLGRLLLPPGSIPDGTDQLLIVADGALHYLPFATMGSPRMSQGQYSETLLVDDFEIHYLPSTALSMLLGSSSEWTPPRSVAVFADAVFSEQDTRLSQVEATASARPTDRPGGPKRWRDLLPRLQWTRREADVLASLVEGDQKMVALGLEATKQRVLGTDLRRYQILHFATHARIDETYPSLSALVLSRFDSRGRVIDNELRMHEIYDLDLAADLVVLSGCQTALGRQVRGNGLLSLTRGFFYAGSSRVLVSLWSVDDEATAALMTFFYRALFEGGQRPAQALRSAQNELRATGRWKSPYYWAPWVLQGRP